MKLEPETLQQIADDIKLAKSMADVNSPADVLSLSNRMIGYLDLIMSEIAELDYKSNQLSGKKRTLEEYIRTSKERYKELRELAKHY